MTETVKNPQQPVPEADNSQTPQTLPAQRDSGFEILPQRGGARIRVRYREGSLNGSCKLCR